MPGESLSSYTRAPEDGAEALKIKEADGASFAQKFTLISDEQAIAEFAVGPSGKDRNWILRGSELSLMDKKHGVVYKKKINLPAPIPASPQPSPAQAAPVPVSPAPAPAPAPVRPTSPISTTAQRLGPQSGDGPVDDPALAFPPPVEPPAAPKLPVERFNPPDPKAAPSPTIEKFSAPAATEQVLEPKLPPLPESTESSPQIQLPSDKSPRSPKRLETPVELSPPKRKKSKLSEKAEEIKSLIDSTEAALGTFSAPKGEVIVTEESIQSQASPESENEITLDPNINEAWITRNGKEVARFAIGTGDTTGTRYGTKYFSPVGVWQVRDKIPYGDVEGSYGPWWLGLNTPDDEWGMRTTFGLHGPYANKDLSAEGDSFVNKGFVSHGCMRFTERDMATVGQFLSVGSNVTVLPYTGGRKVLPNAPAIKNALPAGTIR